ncbi:MAG: 5'-3' exonuclease H3TH domain-containing protein [Gammaproteobacteria bacterium]
MVYLIDASVYVFRAYYSVPADMVDGHGQPTNAVYGFTRFLLDLLTETAATHVVVAFDESLTTSFRNELYPAYKANREPAPDELKRQFLSCRRLCEALGLRHEAHEKFEADDLIGTLAQHCRAQQQSVSIVTRDKDLAQLVGPDDEFYDYASRARYGYEQIEAQFGTRPESIADYLALTGDAVDNIRGVPGVGKKTAAAIFAQYQSLDEVYGHLDALQSLPIRGARTLAAKLEKHRADAYLAQQLTRIRCDVPMDSSLESMRRRSSEPALVNGLFDDLGFGDGLRERALALEVS